MVRGLRLLKRLLACSCLLLLCILLPTGLPIHVVNTASVLDLRV